jgi:hypothetical protein
MNIITKNMNEMNTNSHNNCNKHIKVMKIQKRGGTKIIPNHALDMIRNPSEACLLPFRSGLTSYALEYGGALRMIRVSVFSNDLCLRRVTWAGIYRPECQS